MASRHDGTQETLLGLDAGTSSTKAVLVGADGAVVAEASLPHTVDMPAPGWAEQDPDGDGCGPSVQAPSGRRWCP